MNAYILQITALALTGVALLGLSYVLWTLSGIKKKLAIVFGEGSDADVDSHQQALRRIARIETKIEAAEPRLLDVEQSALTSVQKVAFQRFNPFQDTGGDNSFVLALLDKENSGVVLSSLYTREGVRVYGKRVEQGSSRHPLSEEEKKVLAEALAKSKTA